MGRRITFGGRGRGCATSDGGSPPAVSITEPRVKFVRGQFTTGTPDAGYVACGPGTAFPLEVTLAQLSEIMYRVRDSRLSGSIEQTASGVTVGFSFSGTPAEELVSQFSQYDYNWFCRRGYAATNVDGFERFFDDAYSVGGTDYFDASDELGMWMPSLARTGFSHEFIITSLGGLETDPLPDYYLAYNTVDSSISPAEATLAFNGKVAWEDINESGDPFDPANRLYLGMSLDIWGTLYFSTYVSTDISTAGNGLYTGLELEIELRPDEVLSCPLYYSDGDVTATFSGAIRITATKWWPYGHEGGAPFWNRFDGTRLPDASPTLYSPLIA